MAKCCLKTGLWVLMIILLVPLQSGCRSIKALIPGRSEEPKTSEEEIQHQLDSFYDRFASRVESLASQIELQTTNLNTIRRTIFLKMRLTAACRSAISARPATAAYLNSWIMCIQFQNYFETGPGREIAGTNQVLIVKAAHELRGEIEQMGASFLPEKRMAELAQDVEAFAQQHPMTDQRHMAGAEVAVGEDPRFGWLVELPLSPLRAFQGVDKTAAAMHAFTVEAAAMNRTAADLPRKTAWEVQLLMLNVRSYMDELLGRLNEEQTNINATLREARKTIEAIQPIGTSVESIAASIERSLTVTSNIVGTGKGGAPEPAAEKPPFKVEEYTDAFEAARPALLELHKVLSDIDRLTSTNVLPERLKVVEASASATVDDVEKSARALVNHATVRALQLMLVGFATLFAWSWIQMRRRERRPPSAG